jgi:hypothetical protein
MDMTEMYGVTYPELVEDRDGEMMPFNPETVDDPRLPDWQNLDWKNNWCRCGHLTVDHHFEVGKNEPVMPCWAVGCSCVLQLEGVT